MKIPKDYKVIDLGIALHSLKKVCKASNFHFQRNRNVGEDGDLELGIGSNFVYFNPTSGKWQTGHYVHYRGNRYEPPSDDLNFDEKEYDHYNAAIRYALGREAMEYTVDCWVNECIGEVNDFLYNYEIGAEK